MEKYFTTEQVANILQVHPFTILKFIKSGKLKGIKLGRVYRIKESDVQEFLESRMTGTKTNETNETNEKKEDKKEIKDKKPFDLKSKDGGDDEHYYII